jgi:hypothetical protein
MLSNKSHNTLFGIIKQCIYQITKTIDDIYNESSVVTNHGHQEFLPIHYSENWPVVSDSYIIGDDTNHY